MAKRGTITEAFNRAAGAVTNAAGSMWAVLVALLVLVAWAISGPFLGFSETWQLVINTGTTIVTFLMVFIIQHAQNRETRALQLKLNELLASHKAASNELIDIEEASDERLDELLHRYEAVAKRVREERDRARRDD